MNKVKVKKISNVLLTVLLFIFLAICVFSVIITLFSKKDPDGAVNIFGHQMRIVLSDSMAECETTDVSKYEIKDIPVNSAVFVELVPNDPKEAEEWFKNEIKPGDVLTFRYVYTSQVTITHRIIDKYEKPDGGFIITLAGDNKSSEDGALIQTIDTSDSTSPNYVIGKVTGQSFLLGVIISVLTSPIGSFLLIVLPCLIIIVFEIIKITKAISSDKKKREQETFLQKDSEIAELRKKLAELEEASSDKEDSEEASSPEDNGGKT